MTRRMRVCRDRGSITAFVVIMTIVVVVCGGLAIDGARLVGARIRAADLAENAARVGAQELLSVRSGSSDLDPARAVQAAEAYLVRVGVAGTVTADAHEVVVTVRTAVDMAVLGVIGVGTRTVTATRRARPVSR